MVTDATDWPPPPIALGALDLGRLTFVRQLVEHRDDGDHSRWILRGPSPERDGIWAYKIWNPSYVRRDMLGPALERGLYGPDVIPAFRGLIAHQGVCRGYAMAWWGSPGRPCPTFVHALWERTRVSGLFAFQYRRSHTRHQGGVVTLIDLEAALPIEQLVTLRKKGLEPEDPDYADWVETVARGNPGSDAARASAQAHLCRLSAPAVASPVGALDWIGRKANGAGVRARRLGNRLLGDRRHLIEL